MLWGPPGSGKTTLATLIAGVTKSHFAPLSAVSAGLADLRKILAAPGSAVERVDALVRVCDQLQDENRSLRQRQDVLTAERANLLQKNEQVRARVEAMIGRLKAMEQGS